MSSRTFNHFYFFVACLAILTWLPWSTGALADHTVKVGILHSLSGTMAKSEAPLVDAATLAVEEINAQGGLFGHSLEAIVVDGRSDDDVFAKEAERLITEVGVKALFGCWTSSCRKTLVPIVEKHDNLLIYPMQYEGFESSPNVIYAGLTANQQIIPAISWAGHNLGKNLFLAGSDYVFPRTANAIIKEVATLLGLNIVGETYLPLGASNVDEVVDEILHKKVDVIVNTINGDTNDVFFAQLARASDSPAILSLSVDEHYISSLPGLGGRSYTAWSYYQALDIPENHTFKQHFQRRFGDSQGITDPMITAYLGVWLWAQAVRETGRFDPHEVNRSLVRQSFASPFGVVGVDERTRHLYRPLRIARHRTGKQVEIVWQSDGMIRPEPFPLRRSPNVWRSILDEWADKN